MTLGRILSPLRRALATPKGAVPGLWLVLVIAAAVLAPLLMESTGRPAEAFGWISGAMGLGAVWFYTANYAITPTLGPVRTLQAGVLIGVAGVMLVLTANWPIVLVGAMMIGFGYATTTPAGSRSAGANPDL